MKFTPVATQPNFTAKVKNNDFMQNYVKNSNKDRLDNLKESLTALKNVYPQDTLEIKANKKGGFDVKNENKKTSVSFEAEKRTLQTAEAKLEMPMPLNLPKLLKNIATKGTDEYNKVFNVKEKPATEAKEAQNANQKPTAQEQKAVLDMLA